MAFQRGGTLKACVRIEFVRLVHGFAGSKGAALRGLGHRNHPQAMGKPNFSIIERLTAVNLTGL
jgi:hypothetical protein